MLINELLKNLVVFYEIISLKVQMIKEKLQCMKIYSLNSQFLVKI